MAVATERVVGRDEREHAVRAAVATLVDVATLRWIGFSHFESDECGALNPWLEAAPRATPLAGVVAAILVGYLFFG